MNEYSQDPIQISTNEQLTHQTHAPVPKRPPSKILFALILLFAVLSALCIWRVLLNVKDSSSSKKFFSDSPTSNVVHNNYRVYKSVLGPTNDEVTTYTLVDENGKKVTSAEYDSGYQMIAPLNDGSFLFHDGSPKEGGGNRMFGKQGFQEFLRYPASMHSYSSSDQGGPVGVTGFSEGSVVYQACAESSGNNVSVYRCGEIRRNKLLTGEESILKLPSKLVEYQSELLTFSSDMRYAYFLGIANNEREKLQNASSSQDIQIKRSIFKLELASNKIVSEKLVKTPPTYYEKFWLSPNGKDLIYSKEGELGKLQHVAVESGVIKVINLPTKSNASEPWGSTTTTVDPLFSPDGNYIAFVTYDSTSGSSQLSERLGIIDLRSLVATQYAQEPVDNPHKSQSSIFFDNLRWYESGVLEFTGGLENFSLKPGASSPTKLDSSYGLLVGLADGRP